DSDRDGHFNLYGYGVKDGNTTQLTRNTVYDLRWPSTDKQARIIYELNGGLEIFDVKTRKTTPVSITVPGDAVARRPSRVSAAGLVESVALSPKGERVLFG